MMLFDLSFMQPFDDAVRGCQLVDLKLKDLTSFLIITNGLHYVYYRNEIEMLV